MDFLGQLETFWHFILTILFENAKLSKKKKKKKKMTLVFQNCVSVGKGQKGKQTFFFKA